MILVTSNNTNSEEEIVKKVEAALRNEEVSVFIADDESFTIEQLMSMGVYNLLKTRTYVGRLERNTRKMDEGLDDLRDLLAPVSVYFSKLLEDLDQASTDTAGDAVTLKKHLQQHNETKKRLSEERNS
jgi:hypothetical protein